MAAAAHGSRRNPRRALARIPPGIWTALGIGALVVLPLLGSTRLLRVELRRATSGEDGLSRLLARFADLRRDLPRLGTVGWFSDRADGRQYRDVWVIDYHVARHALRPLQVVRTTEPALVVGDFDDLQRALARASEVGLVLARDYGNGLLLFRR